MELPLDADDTSRPSTASSIDNAMPTSPSSMSGDSIQFYGDNPLESQESTSYDPITSPSQLPSVLAASSISGDAGGNASSAASTSTAVGTRRRRHRHHSLALGTGTAKMGSSITDSAPSTEDEMGENEDDTEEDKENGDPDIHYPALATPTVRSSSFWPFGVANGTSNGSITSAREGAMAAGMNNSDGSASPAGEHLLTTQSSQHYAQLARRSSSNAAYLPHEILLKILKNVRATQDLVYALLVCKSWCQCGVELLWNKPLFPHVGPLIKMRFVLSLPVSTFPYASFVKRLNFSQLADRMSDVLLMGLVVCKRLERLTLAGCSEITDEALTMLLKRCQNLVALDLSDCVKITDETVIAAARNCRRLQGLNLSGCKLVSDAGVQGIANGCQLLRRVKLRNLENLSDTAIIALALSCPLLLEVDLYSCTAITDRTLWALFRNCSHLRELSLNNCTSVSGEAFPQKDGSLLYIRGAGDPDLAGKRPMNAKFSSSPPSTRLAGSSKKPLDHGDVFPHLLGTTPLYSRMFEHVRYLDLTGLLNLTDQAVDGIVPTMPHIRNLVLAKCSNLTDESILSICKLGKHIHFLHLGHVNSITDKAVTSLARSCTRLRYIDLACCPLLTDLSVFELAQNLPRLKRIGLVRVANLTDQAIFALAERTTLERIHLSYCEHVSVSAIQFLLIRLHRLNHLSLTGVPAFRRADLQHFCRPPPKDFNTHQRSTFCVYSGKGVHELRKHLIALQQQESSSGGSANNRNLLGAYGGNAQGQQPWTVHRSLLAPNPNSGQNLPMHMPFHARQQSLPQIAPMDDIYDEADEDDDLDEDGGDDTEDDRTLSSPQSRTRRSQGLAVPSTANMALLSGPHSRPNHRMTGEHRNRSRRDHHKDQLENVYQPGPSSNTSFSLSPVAPLPLPASTSSCYSSLPSPYTQQHSGLPSEIQPNRNISSSLRDSNGIWPNWPQAPAPQSTGSAAQSTPQSSSSHTIPDHPASLSRSVRSSREPTNYIPYRASSSPTQSQRRSRDSAPANLQAAPHNHQQLRSSYLDTTPSPSFEHVTHPVLSSSHIDSIANSQYLDLDSFRTVLASHTIRAAREQEIYERNMEGPGSSYNQAISSSPPAMTSSQIENGDQRMRELREEPITAVSGQQGAETRSGRGRRDTIKQSTFQVE